MLDFIKFQERKVLNELAVRIDHENLKNNLNPYKESYMKKQGILDRLYRVKMFFLGGYPKGKIDMKRFKIHDIEELLEYANAIEYYSSSGYKFINSFLRDRKTFKLEKIEDDKMKTEKVRFLNLKNKKNQQLPYVPSSNAEYAKRIQSLKLKRLIF